MSIRNIYEKKKQKKLLNTSIEKINIQNAIVYINVVFLSSIHSFMNESKTISPYTKGRFNQINISCMHTSARVLRMYKHGRVKYTSI